MDILETNLDAHPHRQDLLEDTVFGHPSKQTDSSSRLLRLPKFLPPEVGDKWYSELKEVMNTHGAVISRSKDSPDIESTKHTNCVASAQTQGLRCSFGKLGPKIDRSWPRTDLLLANWVPK